MANTEYKNLFSTIRDGIFVVDDQRRIKDCNPAFSTLFGYKLEEIKGKESKFLYENEEIYDTIGKKVKENSGEEESFIYTPDFRKKNGEIFTGEMNVFYVRGHQGKKAGVMGLIRDITDRKKEQELIQENARQFQFLKNASIDGFWKVNTKGQILDVNEAYLKMTGFCRDELLKMVISDFEIIESPEITRKHIQKIIERGSDRFETAHRCKDGGQIDIEASVTYNNYSNNFMVFIHDITARKKADAAIRKKTEELLRANKELEQFTFISSHDLQEPLRTIANFTGLLQRNYQEKLDIQAREYFKYIENATMRMQKLAKDVLDYLIIGHEKDLLYVDCNEKLQQVLNSLDQSIKENNAVISADPLPVVNAYPELESVFFNLISNAIKFRKKDNTPLLVNISAKDHGNEWLFAIKDNGIGIEKKYHERIFLMFQRLHSHEEYPGSGIGLARSKKIIEMHGGKIWVEAKPGLGSIFYFTVPKQVFNDEKNFY